MKIKNPVLCRLIIFFLVLFTGCATLTSRSPVPPDTILIDNQGYEKKHEEPVGFGHGTHIEEYQVACIQCHHEYDAGKKNVWAKGDPVENCAECHSPLDEEGVLLNRLKTAYHRQCCLCHVEINKQGGSAPFENCGECHGNEG